MYAFRLCIFNFSAERWNIRRLRSQSFSSNKVLFQVGRGRVSEKQDRVSTFHYPNSMMETERSLTCSACGGKGHTKKNKLCPNHMQEGMGNQDIAESDTET